jgi:hypothetical protein
MASKKAKTLPERGYLVWWTGRDIQIDPQALRRALAKHGVQQHDGAEIRVREPCGPHEALRRALARNRRALDADTAWRVMGQRESDLSLIFALAAATKKLDLLTYKETALAVVGAIERKDSPDHGKLWSTVTPALRNDVSMQRTLADLEAHYARERGVLGSSELRDIVAKHLHDDCTGITVKAGPVVFVPADAKASLERLRAGLEQVDVQLVSFSVATKDEAQQLAPAVTESLLEQIAKLSTHVAALRAKETRGETFSRRMEELASIRARARLYRELVGAALEEIEAAAESCDAAVQEAVAEVAARGT